VRIVSLLPSTTEILFALGAGPQVVGVTFECDTPAEARLRRVVSTSEMPEGLSPREIDDYVRAAVARGEDLYRLDAGALAGLDADLVITQDLCQVCAVDVQAVDEALAHLGCTADVLTVDPHTVGQMLDSVLLLGERTGQVGPAKQLVEDLRGRLDAVSRAVEARPRPRVLVLEWTDPPYAPGHWIPEMVSLAGGEPALGTAGERSFAVTWEQVHDAAPDVVVCAPCGYGVEQSAALGRAVLDRLPDVPVWAVDADACFVRPGPRLVDGVEALASVLHPSAVPAAPSGAALRLR
jgi:iron complex transport system substrate-binding protein